MTESVPLRKQFQGGAKARPQQTQASGLHSMNTDGFGAQMC